MSVESFLWAKVDPRLRVKANEIIVFGRSLRMKRIFLAANLLTAASAYTVPAMAHEGRSFEPYLVFVGFRNEPAFEDGINAFDFFVNYDVDGDGMCDKPDRSDCIPVDVSKGDTVTGTVHALYLQEQAFNAPVLTDHKLKGKLKQDFSDPSRYNIYFEPNVNGAYGFQLDLTIQKQGKPLAHITGDAGKFVCGKGTQNASGDAFKCVKDIEPFPLNVDDNYRDNTPTDVHP
jgi:hypothetical protein